MSAPFPLFSWLRGQLPEVKLIVRLYQSISSSNPFPTLSDFVEAEYPGYAVQPLTYPVPFTLLGDGSLYVALPGLTWTVVASEEPGCVVHGLYITSLEPGNVQRLVCWVAFTESQPLLQCPDYLCFDFSCAALQLLTPSA